MRAKSWLARMLLTVCCLLPCAAWPADDIVRQTLAHQGKVRSYYLHAPKGFKAGSPLLVLLHGSGRNGLSLVEKWKELAAQHGIVLVGPDSANPALWNINDDGPDFLRDIIEQLKSKYTLDPTRVYLFGHSAGAIYALQLALLESEYFAAVAVHAGALDPKSPAITDYAKRKTPIAIFVGTNDLAFPLPLVRATRDLLAGKGFPVQLIEIEGHNHWYYDRAPQINADAWAFLNRHRLDRAPRFQSYQFRR